MGQHVTSKTKAFAYFKAKPKNPQWSWSAISDTGEVVITLWRDEINYKTKPVSCDFFGHPKLADWIDRQGNRERIENLKYARDHRDGLFRVVIMAAIDPTAEIRQIKETFPQRKMVWRLVALDEETGEFRAEMIEG
jgi:hypothetical protein